MPTDTELIAKGYTFKAKGQCRSEVCLADIEWWQTPHDKMIPLDAGTLEPHWATCPDAKIFSNLKRKEKRILPVTELQTFSKDQLPKPQRFKVYQRKAATTISAMRIAGPFKVMTRGGPAFATDGYLAIDTEGYPYPIEKSVFHSTYEEVTDANRT